MKTKEELNSLIEEVEAVNSKLKTLTKEELQIVSGGFKVDTNDDSSWWRTLMDLFFKQNN